MTNAAPDLNGQVRIAAELRAAAATIQLMHLDLAAPIETTTFRQPGIHLDLSLTPRTPNARLSYRDRWSAQRYERPGRVFLIPPGEVLRARTDPGRQVSVLCTLVPEALRPVCEIDWTDRRIEASLDVASAAIQHLLARLGEEARHPGFASAVLCEALAAQLAVEIARHFLGIGDAPAAGGLAPWRLKLIEERLAQVEQPPSLIELASLCAVSVRQLTRGFRASRGRSIGEHVAQARIEATKRRLATAESVKSIAYAMGFGSPSSFCYAFRKATGRTPRQYRQEHAAGA